MRNVNHILKETQKFEIAHLDKTRYIQNTILDSRNHYAF